MNEKLIAQDAAPRLITDGNEIPSRVKTYTVIVNALDTPFDIYYPMEGDGPWPVVFYIHGGGYVTGWRSMNQGLCRQITRDCGYAVVTPDYVFAPQYQYPTQLEQLYGLLLHLQEQQAVYRLDMSRLAISGNSAGGNFAAALCVMAAERKQLTFVCAGLVYPHLLFNDEELTCDALTDPAMPPEAVAQLLPLYLPNPEADKRRPTVTPLYADAACFPPTIVFHGREDIFYFDGKRLAEKLMDAGQEVTHVVYQEVGHGFLDVAGREDVARKCKNAMCTFLSSYLK